MLYFAFLLSIIYLIIYFNYKAIIKSMRGIEQTASAASSFHNIINNNFPAT